MIDIIQTIFILAIPILLSVTCHEVAHGYVAHLKGDDTAKLMGRLTLNPIKHIDFVGTIIVPIVLYQLGGFIFGWAKPVPINWNRLKNPKIDIALVALAGPLANFVLIFIWALCLKLYIFLVNSGVVTFNPDLGKLFNVGIMINIVLMVFNLLPIPPLDGSKVLFPFLKPKGAQFLYQLEKYGFLILIILLATGALHKVIFLPVIMIYNLVTTLVGL